MFLCLYLNINIFYTISYCSAVNISHSTLPGIERRLPICNCDISPQMPAPAYAHLRPHLLERTSIWKGELRSLVCVSLSIEEPVSPIVTKLDFDWFILDTLDVSVRVPTSDQQ